jgi:hypothetical protein
MDAEAKRFGTNPGMGALYVVRGSDESIGYGLYLGLDARAIATLSQNTYTRLDLTPGPHMLTCMGGGAPLVVEIVAGQPAFIEAASVRSRCLMMPLDQTTGRARVMGDQLVTPRT